MGWQVPQSMLGDNWNVAMQGPEYLLRRDSFLALPLPKRKLGLIAEIRLGRGIRARQSSGEGIRVIRGRHIQSGVLDLDGTDRADTPSDSPDVLLENGDILLPVISRQPIPVIIRHLETPTTIDSSVVRIRLRDESLAIDFLEFLFTTDLLQDQITASAHQLGETTRITPSVLKSLLVPVPSLAKQQEVIGQLREANQLRAEADALEGSLRANLLQLLEE
jgi:hypothetical protein